jgi:hypothetical protein
MQFDVSTEEERVRRGFVDALDPAANSDRAKFYGTAFVSSKVNASTRKHVDEVASTFWTDEEHPGDSRLSAAVILSEEAGRFLTDEAVRNPFLLRWLEIRLRKDFGSTDASLSKCLLSVFGDGLCEGFPLTAMAGSGGLWRIAGTRPIVEKRTDAQAIVVSSDIDGEVSLFLTELPGQDSDSIPTRYFDVARTNFSLCYPPDGTSAHRLAEGHVASDIISSFQRLARLLTAAELLGAAEALLAGAIAFAGNRKQFGTAIGDYQAIGHALADMYTNIEMGRSLIYGASAKHRGDGLPSSVEASASKALACELFGALADRAIQMFGAVGVSWEFGAHLFVRRIKTLQMTWGTRADCEYDLINSLRQRK